MANTTTLGSPEILRCVVDAICSGSTNAEAAALVGLTAKTIQRQKRQAWFADIFQMAASIRRSKRQGDDPPADIRPLLDAAVEQHIASIEPPKPPPRKPPPKGPMTLPNREVIIPEIMPSVRRQPISAEALKAASTAIDEVESHIPTGRVNKGVAWELGVRAVLGRAQELVDDDDQPVGLRVAAWRTLEKTYVELLLHRISTGRSMVETPRTSEQAPSLEEATSARGIPPEVTDQLMDLVAGPVPEEPGGRVVET